MEIPREQTKLRITQWDKVASDEKSVVVEAPTSFNFGDDDLI
jgi:hypothetical protein